MERFLTTVRHALLNDAMGETGPSAPRLAFACALARQCFINDYVYSYTAPEIDQAHALRDRLAASLRRGDVPPAMTIAVVCAYFPLLSIVGAESLMLRGWPEPVAALLEQQVREPVEERILRDRIPRLTTLDDEVSIGVRRQYEEHPYPKWVKLPPSGLIGFDGADPVAGRRRLRSNEQTPQPDILIAGCGRGRSRSRSRSNFPPPACSPWISVWRASRTPSARPAKCGSTMLTTRKPTSASSDRSGVDSTSSTRSECCTISRTPCVGGGNSSRYSRPMDACSSVSTASGHAGCHRRQGVHCRTRICFHHTGHGAAGGT